MSRYMDTVAVASSTPPPLSAEPDELYHSSSDDDFKPTSLPAENDSSSSSEDEATPVATKLAQGKRKRKALSPTEFDSGDEATIQAARSRRAKKRKGDKTADDEDIILSDDEGGEGGLIKTRAQRRIEQRERRPLARTDGATVDVDALWAQLSSAPLRPVSTADSGPSKGNEQATDRDEVVETADLGDEDFITIKKTYIFAGQRTTEEKRVLKTSVEAQEYLALHHIALHKPAQGDESTAPPGPEAQPKETDAVDPHVCSKTLRRPLRRPSRFDPNPTGQVRGLPPELQLTWPRKPTIASTLTQPDQENVSTPALSVTTPRPMPPPERAQKLNVVDKSRLDWAGYVDKEGIAEELDEHGRAKEAYLGRMDFLANVDRKREEERRRAKGVAGI
ncbi:hypothetical protein K432DRAFT_325894 [Lepidopterella palustris CBS 459.81]|uniref:SWR1-complex protein 5 n=1 Tax=Lepidopterella palustris CBS 459.81 TaxID=1314670 RepID=A0A8E2JGM0_9PEZI|nr:hypothetical protein K432DRAFT_325894 [Lepidopterella palustris CBS 459.81]